MCGWGPRVMIPSGTRAGIEKESWRVSEWVQRDARALAEGMERYGLQEQGM